ncbi:MAG: hypothetical protein MUE33_03865 [Cytophagaceae bacterium]|jgi:hypothetical protein|nr:hypothetical protein [Cytophagaceae bacterium]
MEQVLLDIVKIIFPAGLVLYAMYLVVKSFLSKDFEKKLVDIKIKNNEVILPVRLQAYERICLFLERITPHNLIVRVNERGMSAPQLQQRLLAEIREEFAHNMSQQVYMSDESWLRVKQTMEEITTLINTSAQGLSPEHSSIDLAKVVFDRLMQLPNDPVQPTLTFIKNEIRQVM